MLANLVSRDIRTTTGSNLRAVEEAVSHCSWVTSKDKLRESISAKETVPVLDEDQ